MNVLFFKRFEFPRQDPLLVAGIDPCNTYLNHASFSVLNWQRASEFGRTILKLGVKSRLKQAAEGGVA